MFQQYRSIFGLPANQPTVVLNGQDPGITSDEGEADLDLQLAGGVAPNATVKFVVSETTLTAEGIDLSALYIIDNNLAGVMSESFGGCESGIGTAGNEFYNELWEQAAAQGITVLISTGDNGSASLRRSELLRLRHRRNRRERPLFHAVQRGCGRHRLQLLRRQPLVGLLECHQLRHSRHRICQILHSRNSLE